MMGQLTSISTDGSVQSETLLGPPALEELRKIVGGHIELVPFFNTFDGAPCVAFCNEHGKLDGLPANPTAQSYWLRALNNRDPRDYLVGNIAVVTGDTQLMAAL
jgi:Domain of unknown function (DUF3846)